MTPGLARGGPRLAPYEKASCEKDLHEREPYERELEAERARTRPVRAGESMYSLWQASTPRFTLRSSPAYWLITRDTAPHGDRLPEVFTADLEDCRVLPVFGSEHSANWFLDHLPAAVDSAVVDDESAPAALVQSGWRTRAAQSGELVSLLSGSAHSSGPCGGVRRVIADPPVEVFDRARRSGRPVGECYRSFLEHLVQQERERSESSSSGARS